MKLKELKRLLNLLDLYDNYHVLINQDNIFLSIYERVNGYEKIHNFDIKLLNSSGEKDEIFDVENYFTIINE